MQNVYIVTFQGEVLGVFDSLAAAEYSVTLTYAKRHETLTDYHTNGTSYSKYFDTDAGETLLIKAWPVRAEADHL